MHMNVWKTCTYISAMRSTSRRCTPVNFERLSLLQNLLDNFLVQNFLQVHLDQSQLLIYRQFFGHGGVGVSKAKDARIPSGNGANLVIQKCLVGEKKAGAPEEKLVR